MAKKRKEERGSLRVVILEAATRLFLENGYEALSMRQIADAIGYTATTLYRHFANKDAILFALMDDGFQRFGKALSEASREGRDSAERLGSIGKAYVRFGLENPLHYRLMFMQRADLMSEDWFPTSPEQRGSFDVLMDATREAAVAGEFGELDAVHAAHVLWSMVHGMTSLALATPEHVLPSPYEQVIEHGLSAVFLGLQAEGRLMKKEEEDG